MTTGGYQIFDLESKDITAEGGVNIPGAYVKASSGKVLFVSNININGTVIKAAPGYAVEVDGGIGIKVAEVDLLITSADNVSIIE